MDPKGLTDDMTERVKTSELFLVMVRRRSMLILDNIVTMDESAVSFHTPETKQQSMQWLPKGQPGPVKAKVHATRTRQMVLLFFYSKGLIYTNYVPRGTTVNANYIIEALGTFMKILRNKRPQIVARDWLFHWDNAPVHTAAKVTDWLVARAIKLIEHPPYSPDLAPADYFLFPRVKRELAGLTLTQDTFKKLWEGAVRSITAADFAEAFRRWFQRHEKCISIGADTLIKAKNKYCSNYYVFFIISVVRVVSFLTLYVKKINAGEAIVYYYKKCKHRHNKKNHKGQTIVLV
jgi:histone-lysine N-methyltransferase SETMAR